MGIASDITLDEILADWEAGFAALSWQVDLGVTEAIGEDPINRYELLDPVKPAPQGKSMGAQNPAPPVSMSAPAVRPETDAVDVAKALAAQAKTLAELEQLQAQFDLCELKKGARSHVFAGGNPHARVMILGEAPDSEEDREGKPFVGASGQMLDRMFASIGLSRSDLDAQHAVYVGNVMPWRPSGNREPEPHELAMMLPFVERHIALADPEVIVVMGNAALFALTGSKGIMRKRGTWEVAFGKPILPMLHPAYLLRNPLAKREAWADMLALRHWLKTAKGVNRP